jgi:hypothetical protein
MPNLPDLTKLSLVSPGQDVFQTPMSHQHQISQPFNSRSSSTQPTYGHHSYHSSYQPSQYQPTFPMDSAMPRPENVITPSKNAHSVPRTPNPAAMPRGAFEGMTFDNAVSSSPQRDASTFNSTALVSMAAAAPDYGFAIKFYRLFEMAQKFAYAHMNFPSSMKDSQLPHDIKERLMSSATRESAHQLGSTGATRYYLMTKVVLQWIIKHVFKQSLFSKYDLEADYRIAALKDNIYQGMLEYPKKIFHLSLTSSQILHRSSNTNSLSK